MDSTYGKVLAFERPNASRTNAAIETRNKLAHIYGDIVPAIAHSVARSRPWMDADDLSQIGFLFLLEEISPAVDRYIRTRLQGKMLNSSSGRSQREAGYEPLESGLEVADGSSPEDSFIDAEQRQAVRSAVASLPRKQARVIQMNFSETPRRRGRPRKIEKEALHGLKMRLAKAA
jgi:DNA-directed RNA polymerase specialized sigma subunit